MGNLSPNQFAITRSETMHHHGHRFWGHAELRAGGRIGTVIGLGGKKSFQPVELPKLSGSNEL